MKHPSRRDLHRAAVAARKPAAPAAKFTKQRKRKKHVRPRDEHGAVTLTGSRIVLVDVKPDSTQYELSGVVGDGFREHTVRRIWLGGISAQRGY